MNNNKILIGVLAACLLGFACLLYVYFDLMRPAPDSRPSTSVELEPVGANLADVVQEFGFRPYVEEGPRTFVAAWMDDVRFEQLLEAVRKECDGYERTELEPGVSYLFEFSDRTGLRHTVSVARRLNVDRKDVGPETVIGL